eukprot:Colp12_sorted_trinity150504_noHs@10769
MLRSVLLHLALLFVLVHTQTAGRLRAPRLSLNTSPLPTEKRCLVVAAHPSLVSLIVQIKRAGTEVTYIRPDEISEGLLQVNDQLGRFNCILLGEPVPATYALPDTVYRFAAKQDDTRERRSVFLGLATPDVHGQRDADLAYARTEILRKYQNKFGVRSLVANSEPVWQDGLLPRNYYNNRTKNGLASLQVRIATNNWARSQVEALGVSKNLIERLPEGFVAPAMNNEQRSMNFALLQFDAEANEPFDRASIAAAVVTTNGCEELHIFFELSASTPTFNRLFASYVTRADSPRVDPPVVHVTPVVLKPNAKAATQKHHDDEPSIEHHDDPEHHARDTHEVPAAVHVSVEHVDEHMSIQLGGEGAETMAPPGERSQTEVILLAAGLTFMGVCTIAIAIYVFAKLNGDDHGLGDTFALKGSTNLKSQKHKWKGSDLDLFNNVTGSTEPDSE